MYLKVKYDNLQDVGTYFVSKSEELDKVLEDIKSLSNELKNYWDGTDYDKFVNRYNVYIKDAIATSIEINALGHALKKISDLYLGIDNDFGNKVNSMRKKDNE